jgi:hypothetical protein
MLLLILQPIHPGRNSGDAKTNRSSTTRGKNRTTRGRNRVNGFALPLPALDYYPRLSRREEFCQTEKFNSPANFEPNFSRAVFYRSLRFSCPSVSLLALYRCLSLINFFFPISTCKLRAQISAPFPRSNSSRTSYILSTTLNICRPHQSPMP